MSKQLYEEALADVKKLKEVAEDNAKRALLEAVTPRIRELIESQLLGEMQVDPDKILMDELPEIRFSGEQNPDNMPIDSSEELEDYKFPTGEVEPDVTGYPGSSDECSDEDNVDMIGYPASNPNEEVYTLSVEAAKALKVLSNKRHLPSFQFEALLRNVNKKIRAALDSSKRIKESALYSQNIETIISEVKDMYVHLQTNLRETPKKKSYESILENYYLTLKRLTEQKMKNRRNLTEMEITIDVPVEGDEAEEALKAALDAAQVTLSTGGDEEESEEGSEGEEPAGEDDELDFGSDEDSDEEDQDSADDDSGSEEEDEEEEEQMEARRLGDNLVVEIDEGMLRREISRMKALREESETKPQSWGHGAGDVGDGYEDEDMGDPFLDIELTTENDDSQESQDQGKKSVANEQDDDADEEEEEEDLSEVDGMEQGYGMDQAADEDSNNKHGGKQSCKPGVPSDTQVEETLRRALSREARIQLEAKKKAGTAKKLAAEAQKKKKPTKKLKEAYNFFARKFNESVRRSNKMRSVLAEAARKGTSLNGGSSGSATETRNLRTKLAETNLFNAKLLFTNKLLQNESLTKRQKAEVIERLDEARSEREVKLVYESVTKSLQGVAARRMTETADRGVMGSSSRPASRASTNLNEGIESDRWARLAGIIK